MNYRTVSLEISVRSKGRKKTRVVPFSLRPLRRIDISHGKPNSPPVNDATPKADFSGVLSPARHRAAFLASNAKGRPAQPWKKRS